MLKELYIENLAVIEKAVIQFSDHFNVFTGETGAGKSILINGINAVLGQRVTKDIVRNGSRKAVITALFTGLSKRLRERLDELAVDYDDDEITVTREINADGGSTARINNRTSTVSVLREIGEMLINIHGQHDNQVLLAPEQHINILDGFGGDFSYLESYKSAFRELQSSARKLGELKRSQKEKNARMQYLESIIDELEPLELTPGEDEAIEDEYMRCKNSVDIINALERSKAALRSDDDCIVDCVSDVEQTLASVSDVYPEVSKYIDRISSVKIELDDIASELVHAADSIETDQGRFEFICSRRDTLNALKRKYSMDLDDLIELYSSSVRELEDISTDTQLIGQLSEQKEKLLEDVTYKARELSSYRKRTAEDFISRVTQELKFLDMPNVILEVRHETGKLAINGMDCIEFLISANKGEEPKPIAKIASGGELSRIMLALKSVLADMDDIPTLIFDEIDTGVSGGAAQKIGIKLREISKKRQVLCVTHLSQIAVMADNHLLIKKETVGERTSTHVTQLDFDGRVLEIARIMGGLDPTQLMLSNAREQLNIYNE
ncbi:MAG: DNA repair protein RecN [Oscillospiraceae bacterium]|nr:DNA repair protein RecN [Oscillospiraceae bacterium]